MPTLAELQFIALAIAGARIVDSYKFKKSLYHNIMIIAKSEPCPTWCESEQHLYFQPGMSPDRNESNTVVHLFDVEAAWFAIHQQLARMHPLKTPRAGQVIPALQLALQGLAGCVITQQVDRVGSLPAHP